MQDRFLKCPYLFLHIYMVSIHLSIYHNYIYMPMYIERERDPAHDKDNIQGSEAFMQQNMCGTATASKRCQEWTLRRRGVAVATCEATSVAISPAVMRETENCTCAEIISVKVKG